MFALVANLESIRLLLTFACFLDFKLYQIDVKSAFLNGTNKEKVLGLRDGFHLPKRSEIIFL